jgi:hypothetical protein
MRRESVLTIISLQVDPGQFLKLLEQLDKALPPPGQAVLEVEEFVRQQLFMLFCISGLTLLNTYTHTAFFGDPHTGMQDEGGFAVWC